MTQRYNFQQGNNLASLFIQQDGKPATYFTCKMAFNHEIGSLRVGTTH